MTTFDRQFAKQRGLMMSAIRALGHIGDPATLPALEDLVKNAGDYPMVENKKANIFATGQSAGLQGHAELAVAEIKEGGLAEPGIRQSEFLSAKHNFYRLTREFNALAGRPMAFSGNDMLLLWPYLWEAGMTGIHTGWGVSPKTGPVDPEKYVELVKAAGDFDCLLYTSPSPRD